MKRPPILDRAEMNPEQGKVYDDILSGPRGAVEGPWAVWVRVPALTDHAQKLGAYFRFGDYLEAAQRELVILLTGRHHRAEYEWWAHSRIAAGAGLDPDVIAAIKDDLPPPFSRPQETALYKFTTELLRTNRVSDQTYAEAVELFGVDTMIHVVGLIGYYSLVSHSLNAFNIPLPEGVEPVFG